MQFFIHTRENRHDCTSCILRYPAAMGIKNKGCWFGSNLKKNNQKPNLYLQLTGATFEGNISSRNLYNQNCSMWSLNIFSN